MLEKGSIDFDKGQVVMAVWLVRCFRFALLNIYQNGSKDETGHMVMGSQESMMYVMVWPNRGPTAEEATAVTLSTLY